LLGPILQTAHPQWSESLDGLVNVATQLLPTPSYQVTLTKSISGKLDTHKLAEVPCAGLVPSWMHSFALADDYVVLVEMPCYYNFGAIMGFSDLLLPSADHVCMDWDGSSPTRVHVLSLRDPSRVATHEFPSLFFFHVAQACVRKDRVDGPTRVELDLCAYDDPTILDALALDRLFDSKGTGAGLPTNARLVRLRLPLPGDGASMASSVDLCDQNLLGGFADFPQIPSTPTGEQSRIIYTTCAHGKTSASNCLARVDALTGAVRTWAGEQGHGEELVGEPKVVLKPGGTCGEGVVLASTVDAEGSALTVLDAETMEQLARCRAPAGPNGEDPPAMPFALHGEWLPAGVS